MRDNVIGEHDVCDDIQYKSSEPNGDREPQAASFLSHISRSVIRHGHFIRVDDCGGMMCGCGGYFVRSFSRFVTSSLGCAVKLLSSAMWPKVVVRQLLLSMPVQSFRVLRPR